MAICRKDLGGVICEYVVFFSKNTLTIYFIHIFLVRSLEYRLINLGRFDNWIVRYIFILSIAVIITAIYRKVEYNVKHFVKGRIKAE